MLKPLKRRKLHDSITEEVLKFIEDNGLQSGDRLPSERFFCEQLQISRASFREAMKMLESYGVIEIRPGSGMYVKAEKTLLGELASFKLHLSAEKKAIQDILDVRELMEQYAIDQIIALKPQGILEQLEAIMDEYERKRERGIVPREEDFAFHRTLYQGSNNQVLLNLFDSIKEIENLWAEKVIDSVEFNVFGRDTEPIHREILKAMKAGDAKLAKKWLRKHFEILRDDLNKFEQRLFP